VAEFVHLRLHSEYSLSDGLVRVKALAKSVAEMGMPAVAVTDRCNFFGLVKFHKAAVAAGLKPIFGADLVVLDGDAAYPLCLLVMNDAGYLNLTRLISRAWQEGQSHDGARVRRAWLQEHADGLLALSGGAAGTSDRRC
jgi:DNA polymerase-3 subunit alpha